MEGLILNNLHLWRFEIYTLIFLGLLMEGEIVLFIAFYLVRQQHLDFFDTLFVVLAGVIAGDTLWYFAGKFVHRVPVLGKMMGKIPPSVDRFLASGSFLSVLTVIFSKFTYGFHRPLLLKLYSTKIKYLHFLRIDALGIIIWVGVFIILGYVFADSFWLLRHQIKYWEIGLLVALVIMGVIFRVVSNLLTQKIFKK